MAAVPESARSDAVGHEVRDDVDQAADRVGAVENRRRAAHDVDLRDTQRVDRRRVRRVVRRDVAHAEAILQNEHLVVA